MIDNCERREYYNLSLIYTNRGRFICSELNHPFLNFTRSERSFNRSLHGEKCALLKFLRLRRGRRGRVGEVSSSEKYILFSVRIRNNKLVRGGIPCPMCRSLLEKVAGKYLDKVYYY